MASGLVCTITGRFNGEARKRVVNPVCTSAEMSSITDLADLIAANRARLERTFDGEIARLRTVHGNRAVDEALRIAEQAQREDAPPSLAFRSK